MRKDVLSFDLSGEHPTLLDPLSTLPFNACPPHADAPAATSMVSRRVSDRAKRVNFKYVTVIDGK